MPEIMSPDSEDFRSEQTEISASALSILNQSEHASMVASANLPNNRRRLKDFDDKLMSYANHSQPVALSMFYSLPRAGKQIIGASIRFAEIVAPCWKNCAVASRVVGDATDTVTAQGIFIDYEANLRNSIEVPRRITGKDGNRFNADMIVTTSNAAMSIARRNAVLKGGVPQALWSPAYEAAQLTAVGKAISHSQRVAEAMEYLMKLGVTEVQALNAVECPSIKDLEIEHLVTLRVLCQEIKRGEKTIEQVFGSPLDKEIDALLTQLGKNTSQSRMLRESYKGRTRELLDYLTGQLAPQATKPTQSVDEFVTQKSTPAFNEKQEAQATEKPAEQDKPAPAATEEVPVGEPKRGRGRPSKEEMARRKAAEEAAAGQQTLVPAEPEKKWTGELPQDTEEAGEHDQEDSVQEDQAGSAFDLV
jgi:hypothetical protein